eukprot:2350307-Pleurochrysis_carterae.AAC.2
MGTNWQDSADWWRVGLNLVDADATNVAGLVDEADEVVLHAHESDVSRSGHVQPMLLDQLLKLGANLCSGGKMGGTQMTSAGRCGLQTRSHGMYATVGLAVEVL